MTNATTTTNVLTSNGEVYSAEEYAQLCEARARLAALPRTPLAPQSNISDAERKAQAAKRANAPLYSNQGFSLLK